MLRMVMIYGWEGASGSMVIITCGLTT